MAIKIAIVIFGALIASFLLVYMVNDGYASQFDYQNIEKWEKRFYTQEFDPDQKKIFLIGSSHTAKTDVFHIDESLKEQGFDYDVYNLSYRGNQPNKRVGSIDLIIQAKPDLVVYGLEFLSFWPDPLIPAKQTIDTIDENTEALLPEPKEILSELWDMQDSDTWDLGNFKNPKLTTLKIIEVASGENKFQYQGGKQPFAPYGKNKILTEEELQQNVEENPFLHHVDLNSKHIDAMKKMINKIQENDIPVVLFTTPHHSLYLETISQKDKENYFLIIQNLENEFGINHYDLHNKYSDLKTWANGDHIASQSEGSIAYSDDIVEIIKKEIKQ